MYIASKYLLGIPYSVTSAEELRSATDRPYFELAECGLDLYVPCDVMHKIDSNPTMDQYYWSMNPTIHRLYLPASTSIRAHNTTIITYSGVGKCLRGLRWIKDEAMQYIVRSIFNLWIHPTEKICF